MHRGEQKLTKEQVPPGKLCFAGKEYLCTDTSQSIAGSYQVDTTRRPYMVLLTPYYGPGKGRAELMAYELVDGILKLTHRPDGGEAQTAVFKRMKP